jgi:hypothetical protein
MARQALMILSGEPTVPPRSRLVTLRTDLPALGGVIGMLRGESQGPFHLAMVAAPSPATDEEIFSSLDSRRLAPGRTYLTKSESIERGLVFSRTASSIAFRGSLELKQSEEHKGQHVGLRTGESLTATTLTLRENQQLPWQLSLVQPADSFPGHLLSIVSILQLSPTSPRVEAAANAPKARRPGMASASGQRALIEAPPLLRPAARQPFALPISLRDRYRQALEAQERLMRSWLKP